MSDVGPLQLTLFETDRASGILPRVIEKFITHCRVAKSLSDNTLRAYCTDLANFLAHCGDLAETVAHRPRQRSSIRWSFTRACAETSNDQTTACRTSIAVQMVGV
jgi:site-specific recombinase XerD